MREESSNKLNQPEQNESVATEDSFPAGLDRNDRVEHLIEELERRKADLEEANRELQRVSHYRSLFLARMSHELRTPLTSILGFSEILLDQERLSEAQRRFCQKIQDSALQLQTSLNQLVDLSRIEAGQTELFLEEFSLREALRDSCAAVARLAHKQQVKVEYDLAPELTTTVSDRAKLRQILYSFLAWSISRGQSGQSVSINAMIVEPSRIQIRIEDDGDAIENPATVLDYGKKSTGELANIDELGVIICRRLLDMMGGAVSIENRETGGVRVMIELPTRLARE
jgi:two-component system, NarL family, sensor histidine kinase BarA